MGFFVAARLHMQSALYLPKLSRAWQLPNRAGHLAGGPHQKSLFFRAVGFVEGVGPHPKRQAEAAAGKPAATAQSRDYLTTGRCGTPLYEESGRTRAFEAYCSTMCAVQPAIRLITNSGVKNSTSKPRSA